MGEIVDLPKGYDGKVETAPAEKSCPVVVEGRLVPKLRAIERGDEVDLILDGRFCFSVPDQLSRVVATAMAQSMAIGAGYVNLHSDAPSRRFAPQVCKIDIDSKGAN